MNSTALVDILFWESFEGLIDLNLIEMKLKFASVDTEVGKLVARIDSMTEG